MPPTAKEEFAGSRLIDCRDAGDTVTVAESSLPPKLAVIIADPLTRPLAMPVSLTTLAIAGLPELHTEAVVTSRETPSAKVAVATNCCMPPLATVAVAGLTVRVERVVDGNPKIGSRP